MDVGKLEAIELAPNDKILIRANDKKSGLVNGQILTVEALGSAGEIKTREGFTLPATFVTWRHGYAVTSHASQSKTVDHVIVAAAALDAKALYVSASRGRHSVAIHCADKDFIGASLRDGSRPAALDLARAQAHFYSASINPRDTENPGAGASEKTALPSFGAAKNNITRAAIATRAIARQKAKTARSKQPERKVNK